MIPRNEKPCKRYQHLQGSHPEHIDEQRRRNHYTTPPERAQDENPDPMRHSLPHLHRER